MVVRVIALLLIVALGENVFGKIPVEKLNSSILKAKSFISANLASLNNVETYCRLKQMNKTYNLRFKMTSDIFVKSLNDFDYQRYYVYKKIFTDSAMAAKDCLDAFSGDERTYLLSLYADQYDIPVDMIDLISAMKDKNTIKCYRTVQNLIVNMSDTAFISRAHQFQDLLSDAMLQFVEDYFFEINYALYLNAIINSRYYKKIPESYLLELIKKQNIKGYWDFDIGIDPQEMQSEEFRLNKLNKQVNSTIISLEILLRYKKIYYG